MRVALLGGSFDPPHRAHVQVIEHLLQSGRFDEVWVFPSPQNPLKPASAPFEDRLAMCRLAFEGLDPRVRVKDDEGTLSGYTIDLIRHLKQHYPKAEFTFVGGSDLKDELPRWKEIEALKKILHFEFLPRPPDPASPFDAISATEVRGKIKKGLPVGDQVPKSVLAYIKNRGLY
ncbi:nicotinate-nicotinamide nucleotide adenylyltransferase [Deltaproteobacteria bacterium PRO3]|nr:nicotinate-nicotinamide nucleotide adenylyltransferase [Deltaproteobacteria bacterium PRO3]